MGVTFTDKLNMYIIALAVSPIPLRSASILRRRQISLGSAPSSFIPALSGILAGMLYRSEMLPLKSYRLPNALARLGRLFAPLIGGTGPGFRPSTAIPDVDGTGNRASTAREDEPPLVPRTETRTGGRNATQEEITQLAAMFPNSSRGQIMRVLQERYALSFLA